MTGDRDALQMRIEAAVCAVPAGVTASYGEIARRAGAPGRARLVGFVLRTCNRPLPWYRIVRADGRSAFPAGSDAFELQWQRLRSEGVHPDPSGRVPHDRAALRDEMDAEIWNPDPGAALRAPPARPSRVRKSQTIRSSACPR